MVVPLDVGSLDSAEKTSLLHQNTLGDVVVNGVGRGVVGESAVHGGIVLVGFGVVKPPERDS